MTIGDADALSGTPSDKPSGERPTLGLVRRVHDFPNAEVWVHCPDCRVVGEVVTAEYSAFRVEFCPRHAAAPDLLAALADLLGRLEHHEWFDASGVAYGEPCQRARAAIAKATGTVAR